MVSSLPEICVFAPVNIAWIKYMGKENGQPTNASFSMTLRDAGTRTTMRIVRAEGPLQWVWSAKGYLPGDSGREKAERFLNDPKIWKNALESFGLNFKTPEGTIEIETHNSVPAGSGIATSASGFAALTLAWTGILAGTNREAFKLRYEEEPAIRVILAEVSTKGSGSACRSFSGPFVEWDPRSGTRVFEVAKQSFVDFILILDETEKSVPSSEAHARVKSSPKFSGRVGRAHARLAQVKEGLKRGDLKTLSAVVLSEALDMHDLFHTSVPHFSYFTAESRKWISRFQNADEKLPSANAILTADAGANLHVFVPESEFSIWERFFSEQNELKFIASKSGKGAYYVDDVQS